MKISIETEDHRNGLDLVILLALLENKVQPPDFDALWDALTSVNISLDMFLKENRFSKSFSNNIPLNRLEEWEDVATGMIENANQILATTYDVRLQNAEPKETDPTVKPD